MVKHLGTVVLETNRLILRRFTQNDLEQTFNHCWCEQDVWKWTSYAPMKNLEEVKTKANMFTDNWIKAYDRLNRYSWAIQLKETGEVIGRYFGMNPDDEISQVELACEIGSRWWNRGLMTEATKRVIQFFIEEVGMNRVYAWYADGNPASGRMQEKSGMKQEGRLRQAGKCNAGIYDQIICAILAEDYFAEKNRKCRSDL